VLIREIHKCLITQLIWVSLEIKVSMRSWKFWLYILGESES